MCVDLLLLQMRKSADERAISVDKKLAEMAATQCQIGEQVSGLQAMAFAELREVVKQSADETRQAMDRQRDHILGALAEDTAGSGLITALVMNKNVRIATVESRYLPICFIYIC